MASGNSRLQRPILVHRKTDSPVFGCPKTGKRFIVSRNRRRYGRSKLYVIPK